MGASARTGVSRTLVSTVNFSYCFSGELCRLRGTLHSQGESHFLPFKEDPSTRICSRKQNPFFAIFDPELPKNRVATKAALGPVSSMGTFAPTGNYVTCTEASRTRSPTRSGPEYDEPTPINKSQRHCRLNYHDAQTDSEAIPSREAALENSLGLRKGPPFKPSRAPLSIR